MDDEMVVSGVTTETSQSLGNPMDTTSEPSADPPAQPENKLSTPADAYSNNTEKSSQMFCRDVMLDRVAKSDGHFKHQQRGEPDLTYTEKLAIAKDLLDNKPAAFLTRFGKYLETEDLEYFQSMADDYIIDFHLKEIRKRLNVHMNQTIVRNRRYEAMKQLVEEGEYFGDEMLKQRDPLLYEQMVGQYLSGEEITAQVNKSDMRFSTILLSHLDIIKNNELYEQQKDEEAQMIEEASDDEDYRKDDEDSDEESELESDEEEKELPTEEKSMLRGEFMRIMQLRFLNGEDSDFDYTKVDTNDEYDSLDIREHDEQEKYFDEEDPETVDMESKSADEDSCSGPVMAQNSQTKLKQSQMLSSDKQTTQMPSAHKQSPQVPPSKTEYNEPKT